MGNRSISLLILILIFSSPAIRVFSQRINAYYDDLDEDIIEEKQNVTAPSTVENTIFEIIFISIAVVGLLANSVVLFVIFCGNEITKTVTAIYVVQLAIADIIFLCVLPFFTLQQLQTEWTFGFVACKICQTVKYLNYYAGMFFLTAMSVDRYIAVAYSTKARQIRTTRRTMTVCGLVWLFSALMSLPAMIYANLEETSDDTICRVMFPGYTNISENEFDVVFVFQNDSSGSDASYYLEFEEGYNLGDGFDSDSFDSDIINCKSKEPFGYILNEVIKLVAGYILPLTVITVSYILILKKLRQSSDSLGATSRSNNSHSLRRRVTRMVIALVVCFSVCWFPYQVYSILVIPGFSVKKFKQCLSIEKAVLVIAYSNSVFNPLLYTFMAHNFRKRLSDSWKKTRSRIQHRSFDFGSAHRKSFLNKTATSRKLAGYCAPFSRVSRAANGNESVTVDTENHGNPNSTKATLLVEMHTENKAQETNLNEVEQMEKSTFVSR